MSDNPDPVIGRVLGELRKAGDKGESALLLLGSPGTFLCVQLFGQKWSRGGSARVIGESLFRGESSGHAFKERCAVLVQWSSSSIARIVGGVGVISRDDIK